MKQNALYSSAESRNSEELILAHKSLAKILKNISTKVWGGGGDKRG
jgi:hypothetical protein